MEPTRKQVATGGLIVPAALAMAMSADTSYRFLETALQITHQTERMVLCGVAEAAIVALTVYAWATRTKGPAYLAYAAVLVQAIPAFTVSGGVGGPVRVVLGPVLLAVLLHLLLGLELRMSGEKSNGLLASALREARERLVAFLGIGRRGADSAAIARSRAADRAVDLADRVAAARQGSRRHARLRAQLAMQIDAARHGLSPAEADAAEAAIVSRVVRRKSAASLATIGIRHDWAASLAQQVREVAPPNPQGESREIAGERPVQAPRETASESREAQGESSTREVAGDAAMYAASLLAHEPPSWSGLSLRQAVAKADEIVPGLTARMLSGVLEQVGVEASSGSIRATRSALRKAEANQT